MNENLIKVFCHICGKEYFRYLPYILQNRIIDKKTYKVEWIKRCKTEATKIRKTKS